MFGLPWKPDFWSDLPWNLKQTFSYPTVATHINWLKFADLPDRYSGLNVWTTTDDDDDDGPLLYYKVTLWTFGSCEIKKRNIYKIFTWVEFDFFNMFLNHFVSTLFFFILQIHMCYSTALRRNRQDAPSFQVLVSSKRLSLGNPPSLVMALKLT